MSSSLFKTSLAVRFHLLQVLAMGKQTQAKKRRRAITLGSDFSGLGTSSLAMKKLCDPVNLNFKTTFTCDNNRACTKILKHNFKPAKHYPDILKRNVKEMESVDVYVFTAECQSFTSNGKQEGLADARGLLIYEAVDYIKQKKPRCFMSENASSLGSKFKHVSDEIVHILRNDYEMHVEQLNTDEYAIPQHRSRWYMLGVRKDVLRRNGLQLLLADGRPSCKWFPKPMTVTIPFDRFVTRLPDHMWKTFPTGRTEVERARAKENIETGIFHVASRHNINPFIKPVVIDIGCSPQYRSVSIDSVNTLTRTRCGYFAYWCTTKGGPLNSSEMARLQGIEDGDIDWRGAGGVSESAYAAALGNAQSVNVIMALLPNLMALAKVVSIEEAQAMKKVWLHSFE